jgi:hypothetical protein
LENGALLNAAENEKHELLITTDQNLRHQQHLGGQKFAILVLLSTSWPRIESKAVEIVAAIRRAQPGVIEELSV